RKAWILAATPSTRPGDLLLLALDQQLALQGMDFQGTGLLGARITDSKPATLADFFLPIGPLPTLAMHADVPLHLRGARDLGHWIGALTPPDSAPYTAWTAETLAHTRPRGLGLADLTAVERVRVPDLPTLTSAMMWRIEDFIDSHLATPLP